MSVLRGPVLWHATTEYDELSRHKRRRSGASGMKLTLVAHDERLQSLRGLAALSVMVGHASLLLPQTRFAMVQGTVFEQGSAVVFFYVLSGFVLGESLRRGGGIRFFVIRRLARLAPAAWASIALGIAVAIAMHHGPIEGAGGWFNDNFLNIRTTPRDIALNFSGISTSINGALWSIQVELFMVLILPIAIVVADRMSVTQNLGVVVALCILSDGLLLPAGFAHPQLRPPAHVYCFYIGLVIPQALETAALRPVLQSGRAVIAGLAVVALSHVLSQVGLFQWQTKFVLDALVSAHVVAYVVGSPRAVGLLRHPLLVRLGDCSYSFYAYGQIVLAGSAFALFQQSHSPWWTTQPALFIVGTLGLALAVNIPLAYASYRWIELPGIRLGRDLSMSRRGLGNLFGRAHLGDESASSAIAVPVKSVVAPDAAAPDRAPAPAAE
jgi:peptidoglycan/LPS O-acetylase OafA/YrhL